MPTALKNPWITARRALVAWGLAAAALAGSPDYDAFSDRDGNIATEQHGKALFKMLQDPEQVEALFTDAERGDPRAKKVWKELETDYFPDIGREVAEKVSRPPCLVPVAREMSGWCVPYWGFIDFLSQEKPGGARLRKALFDGFEERARRRGLENQLVLSAMNALIGVKIATSAVRGAELASRASQAPKASPAPAVSTASNGRRLPFRDPERISEINKTLDRIERGGPFPHGKDGTTYRNEQGRLPQQEPGYYREYTVETPGVPHRGTRRIVQGKDGETYYTDDHYESFVRIDSGGK